MFSQFQHGLYEYGADLIAYLRELEQTTVLPGEYNIIILGKRIVVSAIVL